MTSFVVQPPPGTAWHELILSRLAERDAREKDAFTELFAAHAEARHLASTLESELSSLKGEHAQALKVAALAKEFGSPDSARRFAELEEQVHKLKDERSELYKTQGQNAQKLLELMEAVQKADGTVATLQDENQTLTAKLKTVSIGLRDAQELIREKDHVIQILRDELATHQLELVQREEQLTEREKKVKTLQEENTSLVDRWILLKQEQAARMNEANEYVEFALKSKATSPPLSRQHSLTEKIYDAGMAVSPSFLPQVATKKMSAHDAEINCIQLSPDGNLLATGGNDKRVILYDAYTGGMKSTLSGPLQSVMSIAFNSASELVMGTSNDNSAKIWNVSTGRLKHTLTGHIGKVFAAKFTDAGRVVSGSHDRTIKVWDLNKGFCADTIFTLSSCNDLCLLNGDGTIIASGHLDNNVRIWDTRSKQLIKEISGIHHGQITGVTMHPTQNAILTTSRDNTLKLIDLHSYQTIKTYS
ncbi:hypothetical protein PhCBS80983_g04292 [Powellomyces hirtus]|uniref:Autophagy-related protein 16 domain-containing protein n=1 Tax=Powellomyces hirtus TaxID=109895 RepID=A0A507DZ07_9FUNG|nr:hypothetical protein PhCBS80983_g04292 [Powellomyces hirtus]